MIYAFDIDGTICTDTKGNYTKCKPYHNVIKKINELYNQHTVLLYTARGTTSGRDLYDFTKEQLESWGVKFHNLILGKPHFDVLIDDKVINNKDWYKENKIRLMIDKKIILAADHNGVELKHYLYQYLKNKGYSCIDLGPYVNTESVDYVDYAYQLGNIINDGDADFGILICGTGVGMSIAVNRFEHVRGSLVHNLETASLTREHNDSNVICLGSWINDKSQTERIIDDYLGTAFGEGRHVKRIEKMSIAKPKKIVFTNGCFDILHRGHIELLKFSKKFGDKLVVAINSDKSIRKLKGLDRPINSQSDRKLVLESISEVDEVVVFDELSPDLIREKINPDVIVRGGKFTVNEIRERDNVPEDIIIKIFPIIENKSTTNVINKIKRL